MAEGRNLSAANESCMRLIDAVISYYWLLTRDYALERGEHQIFGQD